MLGVPREALCGFRRWSDTVVAGGGLGTGRSRRTRNITEMLEYFSGAVAERRERPTRLITARRKQRNRRRAADRGRACRRWLLLGSCWSPATKYRTMRPEWEVRERRLQQSLADARSLWQVADRPGPAGGKSRARGFDSPTQCSGAKGNARHRDRGVAIPAGADLIVRVRPGGPDEQAVTPDPSVRSASTARRTARRLQYGIHYCKVGAPLARLETRVALDGLLPTLRAVAGGGETERAGMTNAAGTSTTCRSAWRRKGPKFFFFDGKEARCEFGIGLDFRNPAQVRRPMDRGLTRHAFAARGVTRSSWVRLRLGDGAHFVDERLRCLRGCRWPTGSRVKDSAHPHGTWVRAPLSLHHPVRVAEGRPATVGYPLGRALRARVRARTGWRVRAKRLTASTPQAWAQSWTRP